MIGKIVPWADTLREIFTQAPFRQPKEAFSRVKKLHFFLQLVSELVVLSIRPEDDGTFFCAAQNPAGVARANFTVRLVDNILDSSSGLETASTSSAGTSGAGLQENTDQLNSKAETTEEDDMFKVQKKMDEIKQRQHNRA